MSCFFSPDLLFWRRRLPAQPVSKQLPLRLCAVDNQLQDVIERLGAGVRVAFGTVNAVFTATDDTL